MREFAIPAVAGVVINALYNVIDSIFLGQGVGELGLAATTVAVPATTVMLALSMLVGVGGNSLAAIRFGEGNREDAERVLGNSFTLLIIMGVLVAASGIFLIEPILTISGSTPESHDMSKIFIQIISCGFIFQSVGMGINNFIRTAGAPKRALFTMVIGAVVCTIFNYLFVLVFGWGVVGSASATLIGQLASAIFVTVYFCGNKAPFGLHLKNLRLRGRIAGRILIMGLAPFALQLAAAIVNIVINQMLVRYGAGSAVGPEGALAVIGVVSKVGMFAVFPIIGISQAMQPLLGYNYGAMKFDRVKRTLSVAIRWGTVWAFIATILVHVIPEPIISVFGISSDLLGFATTALQVWLLCFPTAGPQVIGSNYFQATGQPIKSMILTLTRQMIFLLPLFFLCPIYLPRFFGLDPLISICAATPIADVSSFLVTIIFVIREWHRLTRLQNGER